MKRSKQEIERLLLTSVEKVARLTDEGAEPNDAVLTVAKEAGLDAPLIEHVCHAYNIGQQNFQRESTGTSAEKFASFPLADPLVVNREMYPEVNATVLRKRASAQDVDPAYRESAHWYRDLEVKQNNEDTRQSWQKSAAVEEPIIAPPSLKDLEDNERYFRLGVDQARLKSATVTADLRMERGKLRSYFVHTGADVSLAEAECHARHRYGVKWASAIFDFVVGADSRLAKAARFQDGDEVRLGSRPADWNTYPYSIIKTAHALSNDLVEAAEELDGRERLAKTASSLVLERLRPTPEEGGLPCFRKAAAPDDLTSWLQGGGKTSSISSKVKKPKTDEQVAADRETKRTAQTGARSGKPEPAKGLDVPGFAWGRQAVNKGFTGPLKTVAPGRGILSALSTEYQLPDAGSTVESQLSAFEDPGVEMQIRKANILSGLNDLLANDPIIGAEDPETVLKTYNEMTQLNPKIADKPALLRVMLRNVLTNRPQITDIENATRFGR
jgi:hypothetical protein